MSRLETAPGQFERVELEPVGPSMNTGNRTLYRVRFLDRPKRRLLADGSPSSAAEYPEIVHVSAAALELLEADGRYEP